MPMDHRWYQKDSSRVITGKNRTGNVSNRRLDSRDEDENVKPFELSSPEDVWIQNKSYTGAVPQLILGAEPMKLDSLGPIGEFMLSWNILPEPNPDLTVTLPLPNLNHDPNSNPNPNPNPNPNFPCFFGVLSMKNIVINRDGTMRRINNWAELSENEKVSTWRVIAERNRRRIEALQIQNGKESLLVSAVDADNETNSLSKYANSERTKNPELRRRM